MAVNIFTVFTWENKQTDKQKAEALNYSFWLPAEGIY